MINTGISTGITIVAPDGMGEVTPGADVAQLIMATVSADAVGPLRDGDVVVITSKIISKAEGRFFPAAERDALIAAQTVRTVARRGRTAIVETPHGLTLAAAGVDNSNVAADAVLALPVDADASASRLRRAWRDRFGLRVGVIISDTAGRAWRVGQTDLAIGASGVRVSEDYAGRRDAYGNELQVTEVALADELASAADLAKGKLGGRPVAVVRGLAHLVTDDDLPARGLVRDAGSDLFRQGSREAVVAAVLAATGHADRYEEGVATTTTSGVLALVDGLSADARELLAAVLRAAGQEP